MELNLDEAILSLLKRYRGDAGRILIVEHFDNYSRGYIGDRLYALRASGLITEKRGRVLLTRRGWDAECPMILPLSKIVFGRYTAEWCRMPYEDEKDGCPFYGTRAECPPQTPFLDEVLDLSAYEISNSKSYAYWGVLKEEFPTLFLVYREFNLILQEYKMQHEHPDWSVKQCRCCRYYQRGLDSKLRDDARKFAGSREYIFLERPEAYGLNCFSTLRLHGVRLVKKYHTQDKIVKMVLVGPSREPVGLERWFEKEVS